VFHGPLLRATLTVRDLLHVARGGGTGRYRKRRSTTVGDDQVLYAQRDHSVESTTSTAEPRYYTTRTTAKGHGNNCASEVHKD
jgi:hypothetical protein